MALGSALATARNSLKTTTGQMNYVSQNIAGANDPNYTRRVTYTQSGPHGSVYAVVRREDNTRLMENYTLKNSQATSSDVIANGMDRVASVYGTDDYAQSPNKILVEFQKAIREYANSTSSAAAGGAALSQAKDLSTALNEGSRQLEKIRNDSDADIKNSVDHINSLLQQFDDVGKQIFDAERTGKDSFAYQDQRDGILKELSEEIGITTVNHDDGSMSIYGLDGSTLYDKAPRKLTFERSSALPSGTQGNMVLIDGVPLGHSSFKDPYGSGKLGGALKVRDDLVPQYQKQLDETAAMVIKMFDSSSLGASLFLDAGGPAATGAAGRIKYNAADFDGHPEKLGKSGDPEKFGDELLALANSFDKKQTFGAGTGLETNQSIMDFTKNSQTWVETTRKSAVSDAQYKATQKMRAGEALSNGGGVNNDDEMALMLQLEQTYSATARIVSTVGKMLDDLMAAIR